MTWWQRVWNRRHIERQLDAEPGEHFDRLVAECCERTTWLTPSTARLWFDVQFGSPSWTIFDPGSSATPRSFGKALHPMVISGLS